MNFLVAYNGSKQSKSALDLAKKMALWVNAKLFVITSMEGGVEEKPEEIASVSEALKTVRQELAEEGFESEVEELVRGLSPGEDIVAFAEENDIDQIFVGVEKRSKTRKLLLGSTAQYIILKSPCPVTTVK